jgi:hypothetical protein
MHGFSRVHFSAAAAEPDTAPTAARPAAEPAVFNIVLLSMVYLSCFQEGVGSFRGVR